MQGDGADQLGIIVAHAQGSLGRFTDDSKGFGQKFVQGLALLQAGPEFARLAAEILIGQSLHLGFQSVDACDAGAVLLQKPLIAAAKDLLE